MNLIVCGDALWISCGTWIAFWSGAIGALVAALLSAGVAYLVVRMTNAQARHGVERTIEVAALGDCVAALEGLHEAMRRYDESKPFDAGTFTLPMRAAVARLQMSRKETIPVSNILILWPEMLSHLVEDYKKDASDSDGLLLLVAEISSIATASLPWCTSDEYRKNESLGLLMEADKKLHNAYMSW